MGKCITYIPVHIAPTGTHGQFKHHLRWNAIRYGTTRSGNGLNEIRAWRRVGRIVRERPDRVLRENVRIGEAISTTSCQDRNEDRVSLLVRVRGPTFRGIESAKKGRWE